MAEGRGHRKPECTGSGGCYLPGGDHSGVVTHFRGTTVAAGWGTDCGCGRGMARAEAGDTELAGTGIQGTMCWNQHGSPGRDGKWLDALVDFWKSAELAVGPDRGCEKEARIRHGEASGPGTPFP